ncbi:MAG: glutamate ligase domain-containing protein [Acutalibacteraceae bacterium]
MITTPSRPARRARSRACIRSSQKLVLIAGGYDKKIPFDALGPEICAHVRLLILCGATAEKIEAAVKSAPDYRPGQPEILHAQTLEEAVRLAKQHTVPGDIVTLSQPAPRSTSSKTLWCAARPIKRSCGRCEQEKRYEAE